MKSLAKGMLYAAGLLLAVLLLALLGVNLYLRGPGMRDQVESSLAALVGYPIEYEGLTYLPWRGVKLSRLRIDHRPEIMRVTGEPFFEARALYVDVAPWALVDRRFDVGEVRLWKPALRTMKTPDGSVAWPARAEQGLAGREESSSGAGESANRGGESPTVVLGEAVWFGDLRISEGTVVLLGAGGRRAWVALEGIEGRLDLPSLTQWDEGSVGGEIGALRIRRGMFLEGVLAENLRSPLRLRNDGALAMSEIRAESDGGLIEGSCIGDWRREGWPFHLKGSCRGVSVRALAGRWPARRLFASGQLEAEVDLQGLVREPDTWTGAGHVKVDGAAMARNGFFESFGRYVGLKEFVELRFVAAGTQFAVRERALHFEDLHWKTENLEFQGMGSLGMDRQLCLAARLVFSERVREILRRIERQLPEQVVRKTAPVEGRDRYYRDFGIKGPLNHLRADFLGDQERTLEEIFEVLRNSERAAGRAEG